MPTLQWRHLWDLIDITLWNKDLLYCTLSILSPCLSKEWPLNVIDRNNDLLYCTLTILSLCLSKEWPPNVIELHVLFHNWDHTTVKPSTPLYYLRLHLFLSRSGVSRNDGKLNLVEVLTVQQMKVSVSTFFEFFTTQLIFCR